MLLARDTLDSKDPQSALKSAYTITRAAGIVQDLPNMLNGHASHGTVAWRGGVLVFCSSAEQGERKCERLGLKEMSWELLPELNQPRHDFTPAVWRNAVYLCGGGPPSIEVFDGHSMQVLSLELMDKGEMWTCASDSSLYIFSTNHVSTVFKPADSTTLRLKWEKTHGQNRIESTPVVWREKIRTFRVNTLYWDHEYYVKWELLATL